MSIFPPHALDEFDRPEPTVSAVTILRSDIDSGCSPLLVQCDDGRQYWVKPRNNPHGLESLVSERVVAAVGGWLGAPVVPSTLVHVSADVAQRVTYSNAGLPLVPGVAHGSANIPVTDETVDLINHVRDGNPSRIPGFIALWVWCDGTDEQWLYDLDADHQIWSFDHGTWLGGREEWHLPDLARTESFGGERTFEDLRGLDAEEFERLALKIEGFLETDALRAVASVPVAWGVSNEDLLILAEWLFRSRTTAAARLRDYAGKCTSANARRGRR